MSDKPMFATAVAGVVIMLATATWAIIASFRKNFEEDVVELAMAAVISLLLAALIVDYLRY